LESLRDDFVDTRRHPPLLGEGRRLGAATARGRSRRDRIAAGGVPVADRLRRTGVALCRRDGSLPARTRGLHRSRAVDSGRSRPVAFTAGRRAMNLLRRIVPSPLCSLALLAAWLMLARTPGAVDLTVGAALAIGVPHLFPGLRVQGTRPRRPLVALRYVLTVCRDVIDRKSGV